MLCDLLFIHMILTVILFKTGRSWTPLQAPTHDVDGKSVHCTPSTSHDSKCSLHLYGVTTPHNLGRVFSTPAPGFVMGVGSIGKHLLPYDECDTFLSDDAGLTWKMVAKGAHKYEFGDQGSVLVVVDDEDSTDFVKYSYNDGKSWCVKPGPPPYSRPYM
jgi:Sortilin, neurotensin receptor 3,